MTKKSTKSKESVAETFPDFIDERIEQLKTLFPEVVSEGKVDFEKLRQSLGEIVDDRPERYSFTWRVKKMRSGFCKRRAVRLWFLCQRNPSISTRPATFLLRATTSKS